MSTSAAELFANQDLDAIWEGDLLGRRSDAEFLLSFLLARVEERGKRGLSRSYVVNLDAGWGHGKTFFLARLAKHLQALGYLAATVNAWQDDHADDPLLAVMAAIDKATSPLTSTKKKARNAWNTVKQSGTSIAAAAIKGAALHWSRKAIGAGVDAGLKEFAAAEGQRDAAKAAEQSITGEIGSIIDRRTKSLLDKFNEGQRSITTFRSELQRFLNVLGASKEMPFFVLVDELDRCRPPFAITLLERVKHLFDIDNVVFVVATNTVQLQHSISAVYGSSFDSKGYLRRFFDRSYLFEEPEMRDFLAAMVEQFQVASANISLPPKEGLVSFLGNAFSCFDLSLRDAEQCFDHLRNAITIWREPVPLEMSVVVPMIVGHHLGLELELNTNFIDKLKQRSAGRVRRWRCKFIYRENSQPYDTKETYVTGIELLEKFAQLAGGSPLPKIAAGEYSGWHLWVAERFQYEFSKVHNNSFNVHAPPQSIMCKYPRYIRSAGRLRPSELG